MGRPATQLRYCIMALLAGAAAGSVVIPAHVPNVYGGAALGIWEWGKRMANGTWLPGVTGMIFAFSGADGPTREGSDFTGLLTPQRFGVDFFGNTTLTLGPDQPQVAVASSDVLVVGDGSQPTIVLAYAAWNILVGYAPDAALTASLPNTFAKLTETILPVPPLSPPPPPGCTAEGLNMAICKGANSTFAVAFDEGGGVVALAAMALAAHPTTAAIDAVATARLAPLGKLPAPAMATRGSSSTDFAKLSSKVADHRPRLLHRCTTHHTSGCHPGVPASIISTSPCCPHFLFTAVRNQDVIMYQNNQLAI